MFSKKEQGLQFRLYNFNKGRSFLTVYFVYECYKKQNNQHLDLLLSFQDLFSETFCIFYKLINSIFIIESYSEVVFEIFMKTVTKS